MWFQAQSVNSGQYFIKMKQRIIEDIGAQSVGLKQYELSGKMDW